MISDAFGMTTRAGEIWAYPILTEAGAMPITASTPIVDNEGGKRETITYQLGDKVILRENSQYYSQAPDGMVGEIIEIRERTGLPYSVRWESGASNTYGERDIIYPQANTVTHQELKLGIKVYGTDRNMIHAGYIGIIEKIEDYGEKIWVRWTDSRVTHTVSDHLIIIKGKCPDPQPKRCIDCSTPCDVDREHREQQKRLEAERILIEEEKKEKREKYKTQLTRISVDLHTFLLQELKEFNSISRDFPFMYLLGANKYKVITKAHALRGTVGCKDMQNITPYELIQAKSYMGRYKVDIIGIGRVGKFGTDNKEGIHDIAVMTNYEGCLLSMNTSKMWLYKWIKDGNFSEYVQSNIAVVSNTWKPKIGKKEVNKRCQEQRNRLQY